MLKQINNHLAATRSLVANIGKSRTELVLQPSSFLLSFELDETAQKYLRVFLFQTIQKQDLIVQICVEFFHKNMLIMFV